jgi:hypothetical protein
MNVCDVMLEVFPSLVYVIYYLLFMSLLIYIIVYHLGTLINHVMWRTRAGLITRRC